MLSNLLKVHEWVFESSANRGHAAKGGALELLALKKRLRVLEETDVVSRDRFYQMLRGGELTKGNTEMVRIVECVQEILICICPSR